MPNTKKYFGDKEALHDVIKNRLRAYKKQFNAPRHTELANITAANYVEEIKEEDLYVLIDRFGYTKSVDASSYSRISPDTLEEYHHIVPLRNIDKLCVFTKGGYMHQVKAMNIPKGRAKDKGVLIQNLCKLENDEASPLY